jgi:hypothetical protein
MKASPQRGNREGEKNGKENPEEIEEAGIDQAVDADTWRPLIWKGF